MIPIGIDVGASDVKVVMSQDRNVVFPSAVCAYSPLDTVTGNGTRGRIKIMSGRKSNEFYYGELGLIHGIDVPTIMGQYRLEGQETLALYLAAICEVLDPEDGDKLDIGAVIGVPASMANDEKSKAMLKRTVEGRHSVEWSHHNVCVELNVTVLQVMSQPNGTAFHCLTDWDGVQDGSAQTEGQIAVLDIGGETTDVTRMTNVVVDRSGSIRIGARDLENTVADMVKSFHGVDLDWMARRAAVIQRVVYVNGEKRDIKAIVSSAVDAYASQIVRFFLATIKTDGAELRYVMLTGGGARVFQRHIEQRFPQTRTMIKPELANASGFYKKAVRLAQ